MKPTHFALDTVGGMDASGWMLNIIGAILSLGISVANLSTLDDVTAYSATIQIYGNRLDMSYRLRMCDFGADRLGLNIMVTPTNV